MASRELRVRDRVLVFEPEWGGHQEDWVRLLCTMAPEALGGREVVVLAHPALCARLDEAPDLTTDHVRLEALDGADLERCAGLSPWRRSFALWQLAQTHAQRLEASHVHFLCVDPVQLPVALGRRLGRGVTISGILFRPSQHYAAVFGERPWGKERWREMRKRLLYSRMLANPSVSRLLSLDPTYPPYAQHRKVRYLPDPVVAAPSLATPEQCAEVRKRWGIGADRYLFVLLGALQARKGVCEALAAVHSLPKEVLTRSALVLAGRLDKDIRSRASSLVSSIQHRSHHTGFSLTVREGFLETEEMSLLMQSADCILAPYQRFVGSSGILNWAAHTRTPVVTQRYGLVGHLARKHGLGPTVETEDFERIAEALVRCETGEGAVDEEGAQSFLDERRPEAFLAELSAAWREDD